MKRVNQFLDMSAAIVAAISQMPKPKFKSFGDGALRMRTFWLMTTMLVLCVCSGCYSFVTCNGTGNKLLVLVRGQEPGFELDPCQCANSFSFGSENVHLEFYSMSGEKLAEGSAQANNNPPSFAWNTYDGFNLIVGPQPNLSRKSLVLLCNESSNDIIVFPSAHEPSSRGGNVLSDAWQVDAGQTVDFATIYAGEGHFDAYDPDNLRNSLADCVIDVSEGDQVIWDGTNLICKEAVVLDLVNTSSADVDIVWLEGKGNLIRTALGPGESLPLGVPEGEAASFNAEIDGTVVDGCVLIDPMAGQQIVWDGTELVGCDPPDPPPPPQTATIDLHNIGTSTGPVIVVEAGKDPTTDGVFVNRFDPRSLEVLTGAPVTIQVWDAEGIGGTNPHLYGECTINDPSTGDSVTWDGVDVTCEDL